jgi:hypothetical protein
MTKVYLALLRGINVGGKNKVPMAELRACIEELGCENVRTYIASGNVMFESNKRSAELTEEIQEALPKKFRLGSELIKILVLSHDQLQKIASEWYLPGCAYNRTIYHLHQELEVHRSVRNDLRRMRPAHQPVRGPLLLRTALHSLRGPIHTGRARSHPPRRRPRTPLHLDRYRLQRFPRVRDILCCRGTTHQRTRWPSPSRQILQRLRCGISTETPCGAFRDIPTPEDPARPRRHILERLHRPAFRSQANRHSRGLTHSRIPTASAPGL